MGRIKKGIMGPFSGKVGTVVGASWHGIDYMRSLPTTSNKSASIRQLGQRAKMILLRGFLLGTDEIIKRSFQNFTQAMPMNGALSYNLKHAITGTCPDLRIDFPNLLFSKGDLHGTSLPEAVSVVSHTLDFSWINSNFSPMNAADDLVTLVVYDPVEMQFSTLSEAGRREEEIVRIVLPEKFSGHAVHCYISFFSQQFQISSTNQYLGAIEVK
jgi:hypothetical protein